MKYDKEEKELLDAYESGKNKTFHSIEKRN